MNSRKTQDYSRERKQGYFFLSTWALLIGAGIISKRVYGHPDHMVLYHLPAAVFLVLAFYKLSGEFRARYREAWEQQRMDFQSKTREHDGHHFIDRQTRRV